MLILVNTCTCIPKQKYLSTMNYSCNSNVVAMYRISYTLTCNVVAIYCISYTLTCNVVAIYCISYTLTCNVVAVRSVGCCHPCLGPCQFCSTQGFSDTTPPPRSPRHTCRSFGSTSLPSFTCWGN